MEFLITLITIILLIVNIYGLFLRKNKKNIHNLHPHMKYVFYVLIFAPFFFPLLLFHYNGLLYMLCMFSFCISDKTKSSMYISSLLVCMLINTFFVHNYEWSHFVENNKGLAWFCVIYAYIAIGLK